MKIASMHNNGVGNHAMGSNIREGVKDARVWMKHEGANNNYNEVGMMYEALSTTNLDKTHRTRFKEGKTMRREVVANFKVWAPWSKTSHGRRGKKLLDPFARLK